MTSRISGANKWILVVLCWIFFIPYLSFGRSSPSRIPRRVTVTINKSRVINRFDPSHALGAAVDGKEKGMIDVQLTSQNIETMRSAGLQSLIYRLRTELGNEVWHWNPQGSWSDPKEKQGYWISNSTSAQPISLSYGYSLPRRGNTIDQAVNDGYSRLDDGNPESFWKSNPYLDEHFTHENNASHQQWIVIEFATKQKINALRLLWGTPFATSYRIQYADFEDISDIALSPVGMWHDFPRGVIRNGTGGDSFLRFTSEPIKTRFIRILLEHSSHTATDGSTDVRDRLGYVLHEIYAGYLEHDKFKDLIRHGMNQRDQTLMHVSSTDPWHREVDIHYDVEQPGLDRIFIDGLTNGLPMILPVGLLFDTPENGANEVGYLRSRGYNFEQVELGEEPDGQYATPEDYGALYCQWAKAIHAVDPSLKLGGPSLQEIEPDTSGRPYRFGNSTWMRRFLSYLRAHGQLSDYKFFSFEWYPFDDVCQPVAAQLARASDLLTKALREMKRQGVTHNFQWLISEYGYSAFATRSEISIEGALFNADVIGRFLTLGGNQAFLYGYASSQPVTDQCTAGNNMLFYMDKKGIIKYPYAPYFGAQLLTQHWLLRNGLHELYPVTSGAANISAYVVHRPDDLWSVLLINKDPQQLNKVQIKFLSTNEPVKKLAAPLEVFQYSSAQYTLNNDKLNPAPIKNDPPSHTVLNGDDANWISLPPYSLTVVQGRVSR